MSSPTAVRLLSLSVFLGLAAWARADDPPSKATEAEQRLAEMEKKIKTLLEDVQALRKEIPLKPERPGAKMTFNVLTLKHADATAMVKILNDLFRTTERTQMRIVADPRTNSVIVLATAETLEAIKELLQVLEETTKDTDREKPKQAPRGEGPARGGEATKAPQKNPKK